MKTQLARRRNAAVIFLAILAAWTAKAQMSIDTVWLPVTDAERNLKAPLVEKDAGAEILFWRVHVRDELLNRQDLQRVLYHYVRLKIFDEKGKEKAATIDIPFGDKTSILYVTGRAIKADGTEVELKKDAVYERDLVRAGHTRLRMKSFAMPGIEPGAIVEYRWKEVLNDPSIAYLRIQFQREFPAEKVTYFVAPLAKDYTSYRMSVWPFNCRPSPVKLEGDGFNSISVENVPAFREEPMMPGEPNVRPWALLFYHTDGDRNPEKYWNDTGKSMYRDYLKPALKSNDEVKQAAGAAVAGAKTDEEKVEALIRYIHKNVRDLFGAQVTEAERDKILKQMPKDRERTAAEVFKSGIGMADELNVLFASMASSVGLETRAALVADKEDITFSPAMADRYFLRNIDMAANLGGNWRLFDVSQRLLPSNMLSWREEGMNALLTDPKKPVFIASAPSPPEASLALRRAAFTLAEDGAIEGDVRLQYSGHLAFDRRREMERETAERRVESLKEEVGKWLPDAELSDLHIENADDPEQPLKLRYHVKLSGYAQRTGKRLLLQPLFFQRGDSPVFSAAERRYPIQFPYAWKEDDEVTISIPDGFAFDNVEIPGSINFGKPGSYELHALKRGARQLICQRRLVFGKDGLISYPPEAYAAVKNVFDQIHTRDEMTISLKQAQVADKK